MVKVGLIGFGRLGKIHAKSIHSSDYGDLVSVCDRSSEKLNEAKEKYNLQTYLDINEFLASDIDAVVIASSTPMHLRHISLAASANKSIFTEKPVGLSLAETDGALAKVVKAGVKFQIGFQRRWDSDYLAMKQTIDSGSLGRPVLFKAYGRDPNASNPQNWGLDKNGGLFLNAAIHDYDAARFILDSEVSKVSAVGATLVHHGLNEFDDIDTCNTTLFMKNGTMAITEWSRYASYGYDVAAEVICEHGRIEIGTKRNSRLTIYKENEKAASVYEIFESAYKNEINAFLMAVQNDASTSPNITDARAALQIALAARESFTQQGRYITLSELTPLTA
jgi:predicted dehydrogenase